MHTTPSLEGLKIEEYSIRIAEAWKIGQKGLDNGAILTIAPQERDVRIEVGYGLEGVIPDAVALRIIRDHVLPQFRAGNLEAGILTGAQAIMQAASGEVLPLPERSGRERRRGGGLPVWIWLIFFLFAFGTRGLFFWPFLAGSMLGGRRSGGIGGGFGGGASEEASVAAVADSGAAVPRGAGDACREAVRFEGVPGRGGRGPRG